MDKEEIKNTAELLRNGYTKEEIEGMDEEDINNVKELLAAGYKKEEIEG